MIKQLYSSLKENLHFYLPAVRTIGLYNNQFAHANGTGKEGRNQKPFDYPAIFLEFNNFEFRDLSMGVQEFDFELIVHFGWKSFQDEDDNMLNQLENLYWTIQRFQQGSFARLSRIRDEWDTNHGDVIITKTTYRGYGKDFNRWVFNPDILATITGVTTNTNVNYSASTYDPHWFSGATIDNGDNTIDVWSGSTNGCDADLPY